MLGGAIALKKKYNIITFAHLLRIQYADAVHMIDCSS